MGGESLRSSAIFLIVSSRGNPTLRQHYVPVKFLSAWADNETLWVRYGHSEPRKTSIRGCGFENGIYTLPELGFEEYLEVLRFVQETFSGGKNKLRYYVRRTTLPWMWKRVSEGKLTRSEECVLMDMVSRGFMSHGTMELMRRIDGRVRAGMTVPAETMAMIDRMNVEGFESQMCRYENAFWGILDALRHGDVSSLKDNNSVLAFVDYTLTQFLRTPKYLELARKIEANYNEKVAKHIRLAIVYRFKEHLLIEINSRRKVYRIELIRNDTNLDFIIGDVPIVNLEGHEYPKHMDMFLPISPRLAVFMGEKSRLRTEHSYLLSLDSESVDFLNRRICEESVLQIYAKSKDVLAGRGYCAMNLLPTAAAS